MMVIWFALHNYIERLCFNTLEKHTVSNQSNICLKSIQCIDNARIFVRLSHT